MHWWDVLFVAWAGWQVMRIANALEDVSHTLRQCREQLERVGDLVEYDDDDCTD